MIKSNTIVLFIKVAPGRMSELARVVTCATKSENNRATRDPVPTRSVVPDGSSGLQEQEAAPQRSCE